MADDKIELELVVDDKGTVAVKRFLRTTERETRRTADRVEQSLTRGFTGWLRKAQMGLDRLGRRITSIQGMLLAMAGGYGVKRLAGSFLEAARVTENYRVRLKILLGSVEEGNRLFREMSKYASQVPFRYEEIMASATALSGVMKGGVDEIKKWMPIIGDLAAASGLSIEETTSQVIRMYSAGAAAADMFRERGILAMLGFQAGVSYSAEETRRRLIEAWEDPASKFRGATKDMARTWDGLMSMISDKWFQLRNKVMSAELFETLKQQVKALDQAFGDWIKTNQRLIAQKVPEYIEKTRSAVSKLVSLYRSLPDDVIGAAGIGIVGRLLFGGKIGALLAGLFFVKRKIDAIRGWLDKQIWGEEVPTYEWAKKKIEMSRIFGGGRSRGHGAGGAFPAPPKPAKKPSVAGIRKELMEEAIPGASDPRAFYARARRELFGFHDAALAVLQGQQAATEEATKSQTEKWQRHYSDITTLSQQTFSTLASLSERTAFAMEQNFSNFFFDVMTGKFKSLGDYATAVLRSIQRATADYLGQVARVGIFGSGGKGGLLNKIAGWWRGGYYAMGDTSWAAYYHSGGIVGSPTWGRLLPASTFRAAPRLHDGLAPDEFPAVLPVSYTHLTLPTN